MIPLYYVILANYLSVSNKCSFLSIAKENSLQDQIQSISPAKWFTAFYPFVWIAPKKTTNISGRMCQCTIMWKIMFLSTSNV